MLLRRIKFVLLLAILGIASYYAVFMIFAVHTAPNDLVIKHVQILDGTGEKGIYRGDIAIRDGRIVRIGFIPLQNAPVFDAGGLTVMPMPIGIENTDGMLEHLFCTSYPRYPAHYLFFQEGSYQGLNLAQVAQQRGEKPEKAFNYLQSQLPATTKIYLVPLELEEDKLRDGSYSLEELVAYRTGFPAMTMGKADVGMIKTGFKADLYFFISQAYDEESLKRLFLKGELPASAVLLKEGKPVSNG